MSLVDMKSQFQTSWPTVGFAVYLGILAAAHIGKVPPALLQIRAELSLSLGSGGLVVSMFSIVGMVAALALGITSDRIGQRTSIGLGIFCLTIGGVSGALSVGLGTLLASRAIEGLGFIAIATAAPGVVSRLASNADRHFAMGIWSSFMPIGFATGVCLSAVLLQFYDWRIVWNSLAGIIAISGLLIIRKFPQNSNYEEKIPFKKIRIILIRPSNWGLSIAFGVYAFQWITVMVWLPSFLTSDMGISVLQASIATAVVVTVNIPGNIFGGALLGAGWHPFKLVAWSGATMAITCAYFFSDPFDSPILILASVTVFSFVAGTIPATLFASAANGQKEALGIANGMLMQGSAIGQFLGPPLIGAVVAYNSYNWSVAAIPLVLASGLTVVLISQATKSI